MEVLLVALGVFLGLAADQWRDDRQQRAQTLETLRRFKVEIENNRAAVTNVKDYHVTTREALAKFFASTAGDRPQVRIDGIRPAQLDRTAWELAISTQSLGDIDPSIAFALTRVYGLQQTYTALSTGLLQAMYLRPDPNSSEFLQSLKVFYDDAIVYEPALLEAYGGVLPMIERAVRD